MITASVALVVLCIAILVLTKNMNRPSWIWIIRLLTAVLLGCGIAGAASGIGGGIRSVLGVYGVGVVMLIALLVIAIDVGVKHESNKAAIGALILLPMLFVAASGPLANAGEQITTTVNGKTESGLSNLLGG